MSRRTKSMKHDDYFTKQRKTLVLNEFLQDSKPAIEPTSFSQKVQSFFVNSYVECMAAVIGCLAMFFPSWLSLVISLTTYILLVGVPILTRQRLMYQFAIITIMTVALFVGITMKIAYIQQFGFQDAQMYGVFLLNVYQMNYLKSFAFEFVTLGIYIVVWLITRHIRRKQKQAELLEETPETFFGNNHYGQARQTLKYFFIGASMFEGLSMPDLLALPLLYLILLLAIVRVVHLTKKRNRMSFSNDDHFVRDQQDWTTWAVEKDRLFNVIVYWQKVCMVLQLAESILSQVSGVDEEINKTDWVKEMLMWIRRDNQDDEMAHWRQVYEKIMTVTIMFFAQCCEKSNSQYFAQESLPEEKSTSNMVIKILFLVTKVVQRCFGKHSNMKEFKKQLYGFLPVLLSWGVRITVALFAYIYNTHVGFYHLLWVIISFLIPMHMFLTISTTVLFPVACFEFAIIYMSNINAHIPVIDEYQFKPIAPFFELMLLYSMVILIGLMIPARLRFRFYVKQHQGSDMTKDFIINKIQNPRSSWVWKVIFIAMMNFKIPVLYLMLFIGNQNFNLFQLGFMMFFVLYGASDYLYIKTSILLPSFICYFILSQYYWSLVYQSYPDYNTDTDFYYLVDSWVPPSSPQIYWAREPNIVLWGLLFIMYLLHVICQQFPDSEQNTIYLQLCDKHICDVIPVLAKWFKLMWHALTMIVMITVLGYVAQQLLQYKSNIINLVYLALFVLTFGKMCSTSFDVSAFKQCIFYAKLIRTYSAFILTLLVTYHMCRFEIFDFDDWFALKKDSFWVLYLNIIGFPDAESDTKKAVQLYTAYLVVGQILENKFQSQMQKNESQVLFDWDSAFQNFRGVERAHEFFRFDTSYIAYRWFHFWPVIDFACTYFHLIANAVIVYFGITLSISLFFAIHITMIVFFYCYNAYKLITKQFAEIPAEVNMDEATDLVRAYKKQMQDAWLKSRQSLWMTQYSITLFFLLMGYFCQFIDEMVVRSNPQGTLRVQLETVRFYMFWSGCYFPPSLQMGSLNIQGLQPVHVMFLIILVEAQAQNWLQSRWGLDKQLTTHFIKLEFYRKLDTLGKQWLPDPTRPGHVAHCHDIMEVEQTQNKISDIPLHKTWHLDQFHNALVVIWKELTPVQTMTVTELKALEIQCFFVFQIQVHLSSQFNKLKLKIDGQYVVLFQSIKDLILAAMIDQRKIDLEYVQFITFSSISTMKKDLVESMWYKYLDAAMLHNAVSEFECRDKIMQQKKTIQILGLKVRLMKLVNRRYGYEMWKGLKLGFEQVTLLLLLINICLKCNITSIVNLVLVTQFLIVQSKEKAMRNVTYVVGALCFFQYWFYLFNLTSRSSPTRFPNGPYPNAQDPEGQYLIPIMYKFEFGRDMRNAFWFSFGIELFDVQILWVDFATLALCAIYQAFYRNPVISKTDKFTWPQNEWKSYLQEYHELMTEKYPTELEYMNTKKRLKELKDNCVYYMLVKNSKILIFTTMHIFTQMVILLMALCRRSFISLFYVIALVPCLLQSASVLDQHTNFINCKQEIDTKRSLPEFQTLSPQAQQKIISQIKYKYKWSFIDLICVWLSVYAWLDFVSQIAFQVPYIPKMPFLSHFGLRKIYDETTYDYIAFISGNYQAPKLNHQHLLMQFLSCIILCAISLQAELFKSQGYINFLQKSDYGLDLLMKLAQLKKQAITYQYNNEKMYKILAVQKTEQQIFGCVERIKLNVDLFRKSQQRSMLTAYARQYQGLYVAKTPLPDTTRCLSRSDATYQMCLTPIQRLAKVLADEKNRREKLVAEQTSYITQMKLPYRATVYLFLMKFSSTYLFIHRSRDMLKFLGNMEHGRQNTAVDLIRIIRGELFTILKRHEEVTKQKLETWPDLQLEELRQTQLYMRWSNIIPRQMAALCRAIISNTAVLAYAFMLLSMFTNAGIITLVYPFVVFGYALLEETRPGKGFWRMMLMFSLVVLLSKYLVNLEFVHINMSDSIVGLDVYMKFGLHHIEHTKDLIWHMMPEMMIVTMILCHEIVEQFTGLYNRSELEVETVPEAIDRIFSTLKDNQFQDINSDGKDQQLTILASPNEQIETNGLLKDKLLEIKSRDTIEFATIEKVDNASNKTLEFQSQSSGGQFDIEHKPVESSLWPKKYFNRLFPSVQQQKPGVDYYGWQTLTGIILCCYLLKHFNSMSATGPYAEQNLFQSEMVYVLLYLMINLIIERYICRTESRKRIERLKKTSEAIKPTINQNELFLPVKHGELMVKMVIQKLRFQSLGDMGNVATLSKLRHEQGVEIAITESLVTPQQKCKFVLHWINLVVVHLYIFWFVPLTSNITLYGTPVCGKDYGCKDFETNENLQWFYIWFMLYFAISARQISQGLPSFRRGSSLMLYEGSENNHYMEHVFNFIIQVFCNTPVIVELRNLLDYTFTRSALDMWQTCQLFMYNSDFYICKLSQREYNRKVLGVPVQGAKKLCYGYVCLAMMLTFVLGPFLLFSDFGGQTIYNPVVEDSLVLKLQVNYTLVRHEDELVKYERQSVPIELYHDDAMSIHDYTYEMFRDKKYNIWPETKFFDPLQVQRTVPALYSDTTWIASDQLRQKLKKLACIANLESADSEQQPPGCDFSLSETNIQNVTFGFQLHTNFKRDGPFQNEEASGFQQRNLDPKESASDRFILSQLSTVMAETCEYNKTQPKPVYSLNITEFFIPKLLLGKTTSVEPIWLSTQETEKSTLQNIVLTYKCDDQWAISTGSTATNKIQFTVFSQRIPVDWLQGYDVTSFYLSFVLIFGMQLRYIFIYLTPRSWLYEVTHPDPMLRLCESIHLCRGRGDLKMEDENHRLFLEILRSPELMHSLCGSTMKGTVAPSDKQQKSHLIPKAFT